MENTSFPLVVIGVGISVSYFFKGFPRIVGYLTIVAGIGMLVIKRS
ncbi:MAG: hypothetical protein HOC18_09745 [Candidatus Marinimicrobia bacterium]|nr:hypothetical protein [Candidatus Neomarinimicrobiota bacterium]